MTNEEDQIDKEFDLHHESTYWRHWQYGEWKDIEAWYRKKYKIPATRRLQFISAQYIYEYLEKIKKWKNVPNAVMILYQPDWNILKSYVNSKHIWDRRRFVDGQPACGSCKKPLVDGVSEVDHIKPIGSGGPEFDLKNLRVTCLKCNDKNTPAYHKKFDGNKKLNNL